MIKGPFPAREVFDNRGKGVKWELQESQGLQPKNYFGFSVFHIPFYPSFSFIRGYIFYPLLLREVKTG